MVVGVPILTHILISLIREKYENSLLSYLEIYIKLF